MKSTGTLQAGTGLWQDPNTDATNSSGFTGLSEGFRTNAGTCGSIGSNGYWWSSTEATSTTAWARNLGYNNGSSNRYNYKKAHGFSVRCLRD